MDEPVTTDAPAPDRTWPIEVRARWRDRGYTRGEMHVLVGILLGLTWMVAVAMVLADRADPVLLVFPAGMAGWILFVWSRRRPGEIALELTPGRLHVTRDGVVPLDLEVPRPGAGWVVVASATIGSREKILLLLDEPGNELGRFRALITPVEITIPAGADPDEIGAWWAAHMPEGTSPSAPPAALPIAALVGAWWPDASHRLGLRNSGSRMPWPEPALREWPAKDRAHRFKAVGFTTAIMLALVAMGIRAGTPTALIAVIPPAIGGLIAGALRFFRP